MKTLNRTGYMAMELDPYSRLFVDFGAKAQGPVLDVGVAFGVTSLAALKKGAFVISNDIDPEHLKVLVKRVPEEQKAKFRAQVGSFPDQLEFADGSLSGVMINRVLHFLDGPTIERGLRKIWRWLAPGGKLFVVCETPFLGIFQKYLPLYRRRKESGESWPGFVSVGEIDPHLLSQIPAFFNVMDPEVISRAFREAGFEIEQVSTFARPDFDEKWQWDGRESVGIIGRKPIPEKGRQG